MKLRPRISARLPHAEISDDRHRVALLRPRRQRPRRRRGAEEGEDGPAVRVKGHSITSSAMARRPGGVGGFGALAVLGVVAGLSLFTWKIGSTGGRAPFP